MSYFNDAQPQLPLIGGVVEQQRRVVPPQVIKGLKSYRHACRLAWKLRHVRNLTRAELARQAKLYPSHVSDYFSRHESRRELPAAQVAAVERVLGNKVISQWLAYQADDMLLSELDAMRRAA
jgi:hypothetical protein